MAVSTPVCKIGWRAAEFDLPGTDGRNWSLADIRGTRGTLVMFLCNHCPYVQAVLDRILRDARDMQAAGIGVVAISSNDADAYPEDGFAAMQALAKARRFPFPYLYDETQTVARAYGAACTPDFYGFNAEDALHYRGRLDSSGRTAAAPDARRELYEAMIQIAETGRGPVNQVASMGCSIKWKA